MLFISLYLLLGRIAAILFFLKCTISPVLFFIQEPYKSSKIAARTDRVAKTLKNKSKIKYKTRLLQNILASPSICIK
jgi:hypothetical protein